MSPSLLAGGSASLPRRGIIVVPYRYVLAGPVTRHLKACDTITAVSLTACSITCSSPGPRGLLPTSVASKDSPVVSKIASSSSCNARAAAAQAVSSPSDTRPEDVRRLQPPGLRLQRLQRLIFRFVSVRPLVIVIPSS